MDSEFDISSQLFECLIPKKGKLWVIMTNLGLYCLVQSNLVSESTQRDNIRNKFTLS